MRVLDGPTFYSAATKLTRSIKSLEHSLERRTLTGLHIADPDSARVIEQLKNDVQTLKDSLSEIGAEVSKIAVERAERILQEKTISYHTLKSAFENIHSRIEDELSLSKILVVEKAHSKYFSGPENIFGQDVTDKFPAAVQDLEYGAKCLALGQPTASVFHMMRAMEEGLKHLAKMLGISYAPSWDAYIKQINLKIQIKYAQKTAAWKKKEPFFVDCIGNIESPKIAWRNPTMHIVRHYSVDEAENILIATRAFLSKIAAHKKK